MRKILEINEVNDFNRYINAPEYHPQVSIVHFDELGKIHHTLNKYKVYAIFVQNKFPDSLTYGIGNYSIDDNSLIATSPGQIGGKEDDGSEEEYSGWALLFDPKFMYGTEFERNISQYNYFSYSSNESLRLTQSEMERIYCLMESIREELIEKSPYYEKIVQDYIITLADHCNRYYDRQFAKEVESNSDLLVRFQKTLVEYYEKQLQYKNGLPSVKYCAENLFMSPNYFGDVIRKAINQNPQKYIREFVVERAKSLIASGKTISEVAYSVGFEYPQHFTRVFKKETGMLPSKYIETIKGANRA